VEDIGQLIAGLETFVRHYGAFAVMLILAIEAIGAPVPGESLLIFASVLAGRGEMSLPALLIFAWVGSVIGDNLGFLIGGKLGRKTVLRYGTKVGLTNERFSKIEMLWVTVWVFLPAYFSEHLAFIVTLAHHKIVVVSFLIAVGLILVVAFFIRRMRETGGTARQ